MCEDAFSLQNYHETFWYSPEKIKTQVSLSQLSTPTFHILLFIAQEITLCGHAIVRGSLSSLDFLGLILNNFKQVELKKQQKANNRKAN